MKLFQINFFFNIFYKNIFFFFCFQEIKINMLLLNEKRTFGLIILFPKL
jgi:hypothetical protein